MGWYLNEVGPSLTDKIDNERRMRVEQDIDIHRQSGRSARRSIAAGTTHIRTFVDIDTDVGLRCFEGVLQTREESPGRARYPDRRLPSERHAHPPRHR